MYIFPRCWSFASACVRYLTGCQALIVYALICRHASRNNRCGFGVLKFDKRGIATEDVDVSIASGLCAS